MSVLMTDVQLSKRGFLASIILFFTYLTMYCVFSVYITGHVVGSSDENNVMASAPFDFVVVITLLLSSFFIHRVDKIRIIWGSSIATSIVIVLLLFTPSIILRLTIILVAGVFFGIGQLASFTYFWSLTVTEERGRVAGLVGFFSLPIFHIVSLMAGTLNFSAIVMLGVILSSGTLIVKLLRPEKKAILTAKKDEEEHHPERRTILLYSVPWALFSLINGTLGRNISLHVSQGVPFSYYMFLATLQLVASVFGVLGGGIIADFFGRRLSLVFSLTLYGVGSALAGLVTNYEMFGFVYVANGLNWGVLSALYLLVVWGDLANKESCAKRYSIGLVTFYLTFGVGRLLMPQISQIPLIVSSLVSCLLIFLSNIPLIFAPELSPLDFREKIKLKLYMNVVKKIK